MALHKTGEKGVSEAATSGEVAGSSASAAALDGGRGNGFMNALLQTATGAAGQVAADAAGQTGAALWGAAELVCGGGGGWGSLSDQSRDVSVDPVQELPATGLNAYEVVADDFVGPLADGQILQSQRDTLDSFDFGAFNVVGDDFAGPMAPGQMRQGEYGDMQQAWLNITSGQGMTMTGSADDQTAMLQLMRDSLHSPTARGLITEIGNDTDASHAISADLGRSQNITGSGTGVMVDTYRTDQIDLDDIQAFPTTADASRPNEMTQSDVMLHVLAERRSHALNPADPFRTHHSAAFTTQNAYRAEQGQSPILGQNGVAKTNDVNVPFGDGSSQLIHFDANNNHAGTGYTP